MLIRDPLNPYTIGTFLSRIPMDGTFDQERPLDYITGEQCYYSYDLKNATDGWPSQFLHLVLIHCFGKALAGAIIDALVYGHFDIPFVKKDIDGTPY